MSDNGGGFLGKLLVLTALGAAAFLGYRYYQKSRDAAEPPEKKPAAGKATAGRQHPASSGQASGSKPATPGAPRPAGKTPAGDERALTPVQEQYLAYARLYRAAPRGKQGRPSLLVTNADSLVGELPGDFRILQIIDRNALIANKLSGQYGVPSYSVWVQGVATAGRTEGSTTRFPEIVFRNTGPRTYRIGSGAERTIHSVAALDRAQFERAMDYLDEQEAKRQDRQDRQQRQAELKERQQLLQNVQAAKKLCADLIDQLARFEADNRHITEHAEVTKKIRMYEGNQGNPRIQELLKRERAKLKALGDVAAADVKTYEDRREELRSEIRAAKMRLAELEGKL